MPAPITHLAVTERLFDDLFNDKNRREFFIGSLFPDIRKIKGTERERTHINDVSLEEICLEDSFMAGLKLHSLIDIAWNKMFSSWERSNSLKLFEDQLFYKETHCLKEAVDYLGEVLPQEMTMGFNREDVFLWHSALRHYMSKKPDKETIREFSFVLLFSEKEAERIDDDISSMYKDEGFCKALRRMHEKLPLFIKNSF